MERDELRPVLQKSHGCDPPSEGTEYRSCPSRGAGSTCAPVTASFKPGLTGRLDCAVARGHGRTPSSSISFSSQCSHPLAIGTNPYTSPVSVSSNARLKLRGRWQETLELRQPVSIGG